MIIYSGLSPLARGTRRRRRGCRFRKRFIPAGAGNSNCTFCAHGKRAVYPRWRGELNLQLRKNTRLNGLSPLARGTQASRFQFSACSRFIPAGAGNSGLLINACRSQAVYPRWRGELDLTLSGKILVSGLSPLARGTPVDRTSRLLRDRFIPAGAGNSPPKRPRR